MPLRRALRRASEMAGEEMSQPTDREQAPDFTRQIPMLPVPQQTSKTTSFFPGLGVNRGATFVLVLGCVVG